MARYGKGKRHFGKRGGGKGGARIITPVPANTTGHTPATTRRVNSRKF